ncbi:FAD-binding oxidoreductase, partial [Schleiferiaceae bacterium]|nr:FAD-binding oxidoreductase [Schleiferiaceae bacterium]
EDLGKECIHQGHFMIADGKAEALVGATYAWDGFHDGPTLAKREELEAHVQKVWDGEFKTVTHKAGIRPAVKDRKPLVGPHPKVKNVWIFNGMGSRAVLMTPYLAQNLVEHFMYGAPLLTECLPERMMK